jgi:UDP-N-acetylmuramoyl-L-alanyl-D-glutamate--2,6-diaminopimelate ligase
MIRASELVKKAIGRELPVGVSDFEVRGVTADSREVEAGFIFVALKGTQADGAAFAGQAMAKGAGLVVSHRGIDGVEPVMVVERANEVLARLAWGFYGIDELLSAGKLKLYGVTGTNGKTTICYLFQHLANRMGRTCGRFGTVDYDLVGRRVEASHTTPDTMQLARLIREAADNGADSIAMELSSHALEQGRAAGLRFSAGAFTNLTGDHLDYHKTMANYLEAKLILFRSLGAEAAAVVNEDDEAAGQVLSASGGRKITYGIDGEADLRATELTMTAAGTRGRITFGEESAELVTPLIGKHNIYNLLAAVGMGIGAGFELGAMCEAIRSTPVVPGRLERVENTAGFEVFVDYAHTDDGLVNVLRALKPLVWNRLIVVFGCGGDRDRTKRPRMAKAAEGYGDVVIVTSDNPRTEEAARIFGDIMTGFSEKEKVRLEADRKAAIGLAIETAREGDIVLIAGKGHETYQIIGKEKFPFDDVAVAKGWLKKVLSA